MTNAQEAFFDELADDPWESIVVAAQNYERKAEDFLSINGSIGGTGGRLEAAQNARREVRNLMRGLDEVKDAKELARLQREVDRYDADIAQLQQSSALARKRAAPLKDVGKRVKLIRREFPNAEPIPNPIVPANKPDREVILDSRKREGALEKEAEKVRHIHVPREHARARLSREFKAIRSLPDFTKYTDRKSSADDWNPENLTPYNIMGILAEVCGHELEAKYEAKFDRFYEARGAGMTISEIKIRIREINKERLELQRLEQAHMLGFERDGVVLTARRLSLFVLLEFRLEGVSRLFGKAGHFEESW